jgi:hypothetical protein
MTKTNEKPISIIAYKGFDKDWKCRGFQFEVGKSYKHDGPVKLCSSGFHACEAPLDCISYYDIIDGNFAAVKLSGVTDEKEIDTKRVGSKISIKAKLNIAGLVTAQIEWCKKYADKKSIASGDASTAASSGYYSTAASSGYYSKAASSGDSSTAASSGDSSTAASSGDSSTAASSGDSSTAASSGYYSKAASSGDASMAASSGYSSKAACDTNGFACVAGINGRAKGKDGSALSLGYQDAQGRNRIAVTYVGEDGIESDVWYMIKDGKFIKS